MIQMAPKSRSAKRQPAPATVSRKQLLVDGSDDTFRNFIHRLLAFSERVEAVRNGFADFIGLSGIQYTALVSIAHLERDNDVSVNALATHLHLSGAFVTTITNQLAALGHIRKSKDKKDRRRMCLVTTPGGRRLLETLAPVQRLVNDQLFEALTAKEFRDLAARMQSLVECGDQAVALLNYVKQGHSPR
jgi:MarR family transcriptional regulator, organic hydroperoxide resistance regulator